MHSHPLGWITSDGKYGQYREVRDWATSRSRRYAMAVPTACRWSAWTESALMLRLPRPVTY